MVKLFRDSVALSDIWVSSNDKLSDFYASSWQRGESALPMLVIRAVLSAVAVCILVWSIIEGPSPYWLIYLTNWGLVLVTAMMLSGIAVSSIYFHRKPEGMESTTDLPWFVSMYWFLSNVGVTIAVMITALYWILLYEPDNYIDESPSRRMFWLDLATHGFNSCVAVVELFCARTPMRFLHLYQPLGVGLWYAAFTAIYYAAGGTDAMGNPFIYEILDWRQGRRAGSIVGISMGGLIAIYIALWVCVICRDKLSTSFVVIPLSRSTSQDLQKAAEKIHTRIV